MARIRLNLKNLSINDKIAKGRQIVTAMTNNASFPNPNPPLTEVNTLLDELTQAFALVQAAKSEVTTRVVMSWLPTSTGTSGLIGSVRTSERRYASVTKTFGTSSTLVATLKEIGLPSEITN